VKRNNIILPGLIYDVLLIFLCNAMSLIIITELAEKLHNFAYVGVLKIWKMEVQVKTKSGRLMAQAASRRPPTGGPGSIPGQSVWYLWWKKWHWDRFFREYLGFSLSLSFHRCSIIRKAKKTIFITELQNKPEGCGASVKPAEGPFTKKKNKIREEVSSTVK
jgi:hypothetical protein